MAHITRFVRSSRSFRLCVFPDKTLRIFCAKGHMIYPLKKKFNQSPIDPDCIFNRDHDRDENFKIKPWLKIKNQSLMKKISSRFDDQKLSTCALVQNNCSWRRWCRNAWFSIKGRLKFFHQGLLKIFQSRFAWKIRIKVWLIRNEFSIAIIIAIKILKSKSDEKMVFYWNVHKRSVL